jgi:hypothetical protein
MEYDHTDLESGEKNSERSAAYNEQDFSLTKKDDTAV